MLKNATIQNLTPFRKYLFAIFALAASACILISCTKQQAETTTTTSTSASTTSTSISGAIIRMYYTFPTDTTKGKTYDSQNFGSAYSSDGVNFTKDSGVRLGPAANLSDPDFFKEDTNKWILFYSKALSSDPSESSRLYKATSSSPNGSFSDDTGISGYDLGNLSSTIKIDSTFYVYLVNNGIKIAIYDPAQNKLTSTGTALSGSVFDPSVIQISSNNFKLFYKMSGDTYMAGSTDGISWSSGVKIASYAEVPGAVYTGGKIYLYYTNSDSSNPDAGKTMVRISSDNGTTFSTAQIVTGLHDGACDPDPVIYE